MWVLKENGPLRALLKSYPCVNLCVFQVCESQRVVILDLSPEPQRVEIVNLQPFEDDESREQDLTSSPTNTTTESRYVLTRCEMFWVLSYQKQLALALKPKCDPLCFL